MAMERNGVERLLAGDAEAFEDFYEAFFARIYRFAERRTAARAKSPGCPWRAAPWSPW